MADLTGMLQAAAGVGGGQEPLYVEDVFSTNLWTGTGTTSSKDIKNDIALGDNVRTSLVGKTLTSLGGAFSGSYPITNINDDEPFPYTFGYVPNTSGYLDIYTDLGSAKVVTAYLIAPQPGPYNLPTAFYVQASNDASSWATVSTFTSISTTLGHWVGYAYRTFSFENSNAYRYWRLQCTTYGSNNVGVSIADWRLLVNEPSSGSGGMVWIKLRSGTQNHAFYDTERGINSYLLCPSTAGETYVSNSFSYNADGFTLGKSTYFNTDLDKNAAWTFRKAPKFFDVVTYTGDNASPRSIAHNLGSTPGCFIVKCTSTTGDWFVWHRSNGDNKFLKLNTTDAVASSAAALQTCNDTTFTIGGNSGVNAAGATYVAYLFAHNAGGFGAEELDNIISCGTYSSGTGSSDIDVNLGFEAQWVLVKDVTSATSSSGHNNHWLLYDTMRFMDLSEASSKPVAVDISNGEPGEYNHEGIAALPTGFRVPGGIQQLNDSGNHKYIYIAIRRPMKLAVEGDKLMNPYIVTGLTYNGSTTASTMYAATIFPDNFRADLAFQKIIGSTSNWYVGSRQVGTKYMSWNNTNNEASSPSAVYDSDFGVWSRDPSYALWAMKRVPGFFDVTTWTGNGANPRQIPHNLGVAPELIITKKRNAVGSWWTWASPAPNSDNGNYACVINGTGAYINQGTSYWGATVSRTATTFSVSSNSDVNGSGSTYLAYLFATCPGVSKVGVYAGTSAAQNIDCGFSNGARLILIHEITVGGDDWYLFDSVNGISAGGADNFFRLNTTSNKSSVNYIEPYSAGFAMAGSGLNISGRNYLFLAIA